MSLETPAGRASLTRICAAFTLLLLVSSLFCAMHELGDTAVYGSGYLFGEISLQTTGGNWADGWDRVQAWLFFFALIVTVHSVIRQRGLWLVSSSLTCLLVLSMRRSYASDGLVGFAMTHRAFWFCSAWALVLGLATVAISLRRPAPPTVLQT